MAHHHHHHHDHHPHSHAPKRFNTAFLIAIILNGMFVIAEAIYAELANSTSLLADAGHNLGDVLGLMMAGAAMLLLTKKATDKYSYGFKRTTILAAFANALILIATTLVIIYESLHKILHPQPMQEIPVIIVAALGIVINGGTAWLFSKGQDDLNIRGAFLHLAYDALISLGVVITATVILFTGWYLLDPIVGLLIAAFILYGAWGLMRDSLNLIMDAVPHNINRDSISKFLENYAGVQAVHHLHIWGLSTREVALTAHLVTPNGLTDHQLHEIHEQLREKFHVHHATIQVERGGETADHCANEHHCAS